MAELDGLGSGCKWIFEQLQSVGQLLLLEICGHSWILKAVDLMKLWLKCCGSCWTDQIIIVEQWQKRCTEVSDRFWQVQCGRLWYLWKALSHQDDGNKAKIGKWKLWGRLQACSLVHSLLVHLMCYEILRGCTDIKGNLIPSLKCVIPVFGENEICRWWNIFKPGQTLRVRTLQCQTLPKSWWSGTPSVQPVDVHFWKWSRRDEKRASNTWNERLWVSYFSVAQALIYPAQRLLLSVLFM